MKHHAVRLAAKLALLFGAPLSAQESTYRIEPGSGRFIRYRHNSSDPQVCATITLPRFMKTKAVCSGLAPAARAGRAKTAAQPRSLPEFF